MAAEAPTTNRFGLTDTNILDQVQKAQRRQDALLVGKQGQGNGPQFQAGNALGFALGSMLKRGVQKATGKKDLEREKAEEVESAQNRAQSAFKAIPDELKDKDTFGSSIQERRQLIEELSASGLSNEADVVRSQVITLMEQQQKFKKLKGETDLQDIKLSDEALEFEKNQKGLREKDELVRNMNLMGTLDLADPVQARQFDRLQKRNDKLTTITGTTEFDIPFDKVTVRNLDKSLAETVGTLDGFQRAKAEFKPEFLQLGSRVKNFALKAADIAGLDIPDDVKAGLREFTTFKQITSTNLNAYIKAITGAQMSEAEAVRLKQDVPSFEDSPETYAAKMDTIIIRLTAVRERTLAALEHDEDADEFRRIRSTTLEEWIDKGTNAELSDEAREATAALGRLAQGLGTDIGAQ
jgi:hypothetical protein